MDMETIKGTSFTDSACSVMAVADGSGTDINGYAVGEGARLRYSVTFKNTEDWTKLHMVKIFLSEGAEFLQAGNGGAYDEHSHAVTYAVDAAGGMCHTVACDVRVKRRDVYTRLAARAAVVMDMGCTETIPVVNEAVIEPVETVHGADGRSISAGIVYWNQAVTYEITYTNFTDSVRDITIHDVPDKRLKNIGDIKDGGISDNGVYKDGVVTWELKDVPARHTGKVSFTARTPRCESSADIRNKATVILHGGDLRFLSVEGEKGAGDMELQTNGVWFHVPEWPGRGTDPADCKRGGDAKVSSKTVSSFMKRDPRLAWDTERTACLVLAVFFVLICAMITRKRKRKRRQAVPKMWNIM